VTITGDGAMKKGEARPLIPQELRAENLAALDCVEWVYVHPSETAVDLLDQVRPDVYVKGREYETNRDPRFRAEREMVERHGGRVVFTSGDVVFSSTALISALEATFSPQQHALRQLVERYDITVSTADALLANVRGKRVCVLGETIIDTYIFCDRPEVAGESPTLTLRPVDHRSFDGGAAIIARHLAAMGARPTLVTAHPRSPDAAAIRERLAVEGVETLWLEVDGPIIEKQRYLVGQQKVMKVDYAPTIALDSRQQTRLLDLAKEAGGACDAAILADYGAGLFSGASISALCKTLRPLVDVLVGDVSGQRSNLTQMREMDLVAPNESELRAAVHDFDEGLNAVVWRLLSATRTKNAIVTLGPEGLIAFSRIAGADESPNAWRTRLSGEHVPALSPFAVDQLGCGDALISATTMAMLGGAPLGLAATIGGVAAASEAQRLGNSVIGSDDIRQGMARVASTNLAMRRDTASMRAG